MAVALGSKPTEWEASIVADSTCLESRVSAKTVAKILSTAGSRAPQRKLASAIQNHITTMVKNEYGCSILTSLVQFGTKQTVASIVPVAVGVVDPKKMTKAQAELIGSATRRPGCSDDADNSLAKVTKVLLANPALTHALSAITHLVSSDPSLLTKAKFLPVFKAIPKFELVTFVKVCIADATDKSVIGEAFWKLLGTKEVSAEVAQAIGVAGLPVINDIGAFILKNNMVKEAAWSCAVAGCIRLADESVSLQIVSVALAGDAETAVVAAVQSRFPERAFGCPKLAAVATEWSRSHLSAFLRTRETVNARIAQKRGREDEEEF